MDMLNGYGQDAFSLAVQLLGQFQSGQQHIGSQQPTLNHTITQNLIRNFQQIPQQHHQQQQQQLQPAKNIKHNTAGVNESLEQINQTGNQSYQQYHTPAPSLHGGQTNEPKQTAQVPANQSSGAPNPSHSSMSITQRQVCNKQFIIFYNN